ncbi:MAG: DoxX family membrane protein, partial [Ignavibacterium sp.]
MKLLSNKYLLFLIRIILGFIFIYAGAEKISNPESFALSISNYKLIPAAALNICAITLPWIELVAGLLLLFGILVKENSSIILFFLSLFT